MPQFLGEGVEVLFSATSDDDSLPGGMQFGGERASDAAGGTDYDDGEVDSMKFGMAVVVVVNKKGGRERRVEVERGYSV